MQKMDELYYQKYGSPPRENPLININTYGKLPIAPVNTSGSVPRSSRQSNIPPLPSSYIEHGDPILEQSTSSMMYPTKDNPLSSPKMDYSLSYSHQLPQSATSRSPNLNPLEKYFSKQELKCFEEYNRYLVMSSPERQKKFYSTLPTSVYKRFNDYLDMESNLKSIGPVGRDSSAASPTYRDRTKQFSSSYSYFDNNESISKEMDDLMSPISNPNYQRSIPNSGNYPSNELPTQSASYYYSRQYDQPKNVVREDYQHYLDDNFDNDYYRHRSTLNPPRERHHSPKRPSSRERYLPYRERTPSPSGFSHHSGSSKKFGSRNSPRDKRRFRNLTRERISPRRKRSRSSNYRSLSRSRNSDSRRENLKENSEGKVKILKEQIKELEKKLKRESTTKSSSDPKNSLEMKKSLKDDLIKKRSRTNIVENHTVKRIKIANNSASTNKSMSQKSEKLNGEKLNTSASKDLNVGKSGQKPDQKPNDEKVERKEKKYELPTTNECVDMKNYKIPKKTSTSTSSKSNDKNRNQISKSKVLSSSKETNKIAIQKKPSAPTKKPTSSSSSEGSSLIVKNQFRPPPYSAPTKEEINEAILAYQWCHLCGIFFETPSEFFNHVHCDWHQTRLGPSDFQIIKNAEDKMNNESILKDDNYVLTTSTSSSSANSELSFCNGKNQDNQFIGTEFFYPLLSFYCDLCEKFLPNKQMAQEHSCSARHSTLYKKYMKKNLSFYKKFNQNRYDDFIKTYHYNRFLDEHKQRYHQECRRLFLEKTNEKIVKETLEYILEIVCNPKNSKQLSSKDKIVPKSHSQNMENNSKLRVTGKDVKKTANDKNVNKIEDNKSKLNKTNDGNKTNTKINDNNEILSNKSTKKPTKEKLLPPKKNDNETKTKDTNRNNSQKNNGEREKRKASIEASHRTTIQTNSLKEKGKKIPPKKVESDQNPKPKKVMENVEMEEDELFDVIDEAE